ncbi:MAG: phenylalanine--tRNA ligase subunit beta, partial [Ignavibacteriales bacterium]|nr:phenylalanine--tRNA ligase subunit beta [Ignavibacteriales bacterium]
IALAGIMGGANSEISEKTREVILESANFHPVHIRKASSKLTLRTESSMRFEKSLAPEQTEIGVLLCHRYFLQEGLKPLTPLVDSGYSSKKVRIPVSVELVNQRLGTSLPESEIQRILKALDFELEEGKKGHYMVTVPPLRATKDIAIPEDLIEEIGRIYGYNNIPEELPPIRCKSPQVEAWRPLTRSLQQSLSFGYGYHETSNYSFSEKQMTLKLVGLPHYQQWEEEQRFVALKNPLGAENDRLRLDLFPGLLKNVLSHFYRSSEVALYEVGRTYHPEKDEEGIITEIRHLSGVRASKKKEPQLFFRVKGELLSAFARLGFKKVDWEPIKEPPFPYYHTKRSALIQIGNQGVGFLFQLKPKIQLDLELPSLVAFDLDIQKLLDAQAQQGKKVFQRIPEFPPITMDLALLVEEKTPMREVQQKIWTCNQKGWLTQVELFDIYRDAERYPGQKSLAFSLEFRSDKGSLTGKQVESEFEKMVKTLEQRGWKLRT